MFFTFYMKTCLFTVSVSVVLATLPDPKNVRVNSVNMGVVLEWNVPQDIPVNLTYTAGYSDIYIAVKSVCQRQTVQKCDFTDEISPFGIYTFHVRAELQGESSGWVNTTKFLPVENTLIGAPTVRLVSKEGNLVVAIEEPVLRSSSLRDIYSQVSYSIRYWREGDEDQITMMNDTEQTSVVLNQLEPWTRYCVQVQVFIKIFQKRGEFSGVMCETTTTDGKLHPWMIWVVLVVSFVVVSVTLPLLFLIIWYSYKGLKFFFSATKLPEHLKEFLIESPHHSIFKAMQNCSLTEEQYHEISIISEGMERHLEEQETLCSHLEGAIGEGGRAGKEKE